MNIIVVGCGRIGAELAYQLFQRGHEVTVVDQYPDNLANLASGFRGRTVTGDVLSREVLARAGVESADAVAVATSSDTLNAVVAHIVTDVFHVSQVVVRNYDPRRRPLHEAFGYQMISSTSWGVERMEELIEHPGMRDVLSAGNGEIRIYEVTVPERLAGRTIGELLPAGQALPVSLTRGGRAVLPAPEVALQAEDVLQVSATQDGASALEQHFRAPEEG
ncbi:MAG: NAD-binding protein [Armatimonadetes bacterium]|nr:NAD-binding protein [Armatimonadota bacterium]